MNQSETYLYAEYAGRKNKFSYIGGIGFSRSRAKQTGENDYTSYLFRPKLTLQYDFTDHAFLRLGGELNNNVPSLSDLSAVEQYIDTLQILRGNPLLKPNLNYTTNLMFNWEKGIFGMNFYSNYIYRPNAGMETVLREDDKFIRMNENQKSWQKLNNELTLSGKPLKDYLMVSLTGGVNYFVSNGNDYFHTYTNFYFRVQVMGMYKKFTGIFQLQTANNDFYGETMNGGEKIHLFMLSYNAGKCTIGAGIYLPFSSQYTRYSENRNSYMPYNMTAYANDFARMAVLRFRWNFDFGRKVKSENKRTNNSDTDSGIVRSDK